MLLKIESKSQEYTLRNALEHLRIPYKVEKLYDKENSVWRFTFDGEETRDKLIDLILENKLVWR